jgi:hypothetical protein
LKNFGKGRLQRYKKERKTIKERKKPEIAKKH